MNVRRIGGLTLVGLLGGCATVPPKAVVWPDPPDPARIKFVRSIRGPADLDASAAAMFWRSLTGSHGGESLGHPLGLALSADGQRLYIADNAVGSVLLADFSQHTLTRFAPQEVLGTPGGVALDAKENVYVSDSSARQVVVFKRNGERLRAFGQAQGMERPTGIAVDPRRRLLYLSDTASRSKRFRVLVFDLDGKYLRDVGDGAGSGEGQFNYQTYLTVDQEGLLYVSDTLNFRLQVFTPDGSFLRMYARAGDGPGSFARLKGVAFDGFGNLYAVDANHSLVQIFNRNFDLLLYFGGATQKIEYMNLPGCIAIDPVKNRIYVCQESFARINVYDLVNTTAADSALSPATAQPGAQAPP
jgi:DNA-binding beta-propeller fold protein YncE